MTVLPILMPIFLGYLADNSAAVAAEKQSLMPLILGYTIWHV